MKNIITLFLLLAGSSVAAQSLTITEQGKATSIRGLSVVNDHIAWVSGSKGHVGISTNGGQTWTWQQVNGFEQSDLRDIEAFSDKEAVIMSSGTPAVILKTVDGGASWKECFRNDDKAWFLDAMDFFDKNTGIVMGDPINGRFVVMLTGDGGSTWKMLNDLPETRKDEAAFAASGTTIKMTGKRSVDIISGGAVSRTFTCPDLKHWKSRLLPIIQGQSSTGAFSLAMGKGNTVFVGGDYVKNTNTDSIACYIDKNGVIQRASKMPAGYQSCVTYVSKGLFLSTGTSGTNMTNDGGISWTKIDAISYNVCQKAKKGNLILFAGDKGKIAVYNK